MRAQGTSTQASACEGVQRCIHGGVDTRTNTGPRAGHALALSLSLAAFRLLTWSMVMRSISKVSMVKWYLCTRASERVCFQGGGGRRGRRSLRGPGWPTREATTGRGPTTGVCVWQAAEGSTRGGRRCAHVCVCVFKVEGGKEGEEVSARARMAYAGSHHGAWTHHGCVCVWQAAEGSTRRGRRCAHVCVCVRVGGGSQGVGTHLTNAATAAPSTMRVSRA